MTGGIAVLLAAIGLALIVMGAKGTYEDVVLVFAAPAPEGKSSKQHEPPSPAVGAVPGASRIL